MRLALDQEIDRAEHADDLEVRSDLARFACVRLVGFLEQALLSCGLTVSARLAHAEARNFAESYLGKSFNPKHGAITEFVGRFNLDWRIDVEEYLAESERGNTLSALVGIRNQIAHGASQGISIQRVKEYRQVVDDLLNLVVERFDPLP